MQCFANTPCSMLLVLTLAAFAAPVRADVSVRVQPHKPVIRLGEPLVLNVIIRNEGDSPVDIYWQNAAPYQEMGLSMPCLSSDGKTFRPWRHGMHRVLSSYAPLSLGPGESRFENQILLGGENSIFVFPEEGVYFIKVACATLRDGKRHLFYSDAIRIKVVQPTERRNRRAYQWLQTHAMDYIALIQVPWQIATATLFSEEKDNELSNSEVDKFVWFLEEYPDTLYAPYIALSIGRRHKLPYDEWQKDRKTARRYFRIARRAAENATLRGLAEAALIELAEDEYPPLERR